MRQISIRAETYGLKKPFRISRGIKTQAETIIVEIRQGDVIGRGEAVPYARYGETVENCNASIEALRPALENGLNRDQLSHALQNGAARNAIDCALWDLECKLAGLTIYQKLSIETPAPLKTAFTISLDTPGYMAEQVAEARDFPLLKVKLGSADGLAGDLDRLRAIRAVAPDHEIIADANEGWSANDLRRYADDLRKFNLSLIEQPIAAGHPHFLGPLDLPFCADESFMDQHDLATLDPGYKWVNIKLDKTGGLTEALLSVEKAKAANLKIMIGCMVSSSLAMAPACVVGQMADIVDLDGPLLLADDVDQPLVYWGAFIQPITPLLWG